MHAIVDWANGLYEAFPLLFLGIWGRFAYVLGLLLVVFSFGGFTFRPNGTWGLGRERVRWDTRALISIALTIVLVMGAGYLGSSIVLVPGAQTLESLKDAMVFVCVLLFGYPALIGVVIAYVLSDIIEGVSPLLLWRWGEAFLMIPAYHWIAYQFIGKQPDFRRLRTWGWYGLFVFLFMVFYPPLWGYACGPLSGVFPAETAYYKITPAVFVTLVFTWVMAPLLMLMALPLARRFGLFWAEIPGRVRERAIGNKAWSWVSGRDAATPLSSGATSGLPIRILIAGPFIALVLLMMGLVAFLSLRSGAASTRQVAESLSAEIARNVTLRADQALAAPDLTAVQRRAALEGLLRDTSLPESGLAYIVDRHGRVVAASRSATTKGLAAPPSVAETALKTLRQQTGGVAGVTAPYSFQFVIVSMEPFGGETWQARIAPYRSASAAEEWWVITALPESVFLQSIREGNSRAAMMFTAAFIVAVLMAALLANLVTNPIRRISTTAQAMAGGDLTQRAPGSGLEELNALSETFNNMVRRLQEAFAETRTGEDKLRTVLETSPLPISWANSRGEIEFWNRKAYELFGYEPEEIDTLAKWFERAYPDPGYRASVIERWNASGMESADADIDREYDITCKDGRVVSMEIMGACIGDLKLAIFNDVTERKRADAALRQVSERLQVATQTANIGIWDWDVLANELVWDDAMYRLYGIHREDFGGAYEAWRNALHPDDLDQMEEEIQAALRGDREYHVEFRILWPDGSVHYLQASARTSRDAHGRAVRMVGVNYDITERKQAEEALRQASERLQMAMEIADMGVWDWDVVKDETIWDDTLHRFYGIPREDFSGHYEVWINSLHPDDRERMQGVIDAELRGERPYNTEFRVILPDGSLRYIHGIGRATRDAQGRALRMVGVNYDITERKLAEQELRRHRDHLEEIVASRTDQLQRMVVLNDQAMELTRSGYWTRQLDDPSGYTSSPRCAEILGDFPSEDWWYSIAHWRSCIEAVSPETAAQVEEWKPQAQAGVGDNPYDEIYPYRRPVDGRVVWIHAQGSVAANPLTGTPEMFGVVQDITDIVEARRALEEARTVAETASRAKSVFLANMSHEIRTPMNAILGMSHLALRGSDDPQQRDYLQKIQRAGQHLLNVINDVLDISKIEAGKLVIENAPFALGALLDDVSNVVADRAAAKGLRLSFDVASDVPVNLVGDRLRLGQVLINLAINAVKFTEEGGVTVSVSKEEGNARGQALRFAVHDTGVGIGEEKIGLLFEAFHQADSSTTRRYGGTGLGLAISRNLVRLMGGEIGVASELDVGSTFWFNVPLETGDRTAAVTDIHGCRILVAEHNGTEERSLTATLARIGFAVTSVDNAVDAIQTFRETVDSGRVFDFVILDLEALRLAGYTLAERIRALSAPRDQCIILVTSGDRLEPMEQAMRSGYEVMEKPVAPSSLLDTMTRMLGAMGRTFVAPAASTESIEALQGMRVLLAEDNEFNQEVARAILTDAGVLVDVAEDGEVAVRMARSQRYDVVLMDMQMPVMDGLTATREIRKLSLCADLPIVAMTANVMHEDCRRCMEAGMDDFVSKPIDPDYLLAVLLRWIRRPDRAAADDLISVGYRPREEDLQ